MCLEVFLYRLNWLYLLITNNLYTYAEINKWAYDTNWPVDSNSTNSNSVFNNDCCSNNRFLSIAEVRVLLNWYLLKIVLWKT
jgi:hypothetical protein